MIFKNNLLPKSLEEYDKLYKQSVDNPEVFWTDVAESFIWKNKWSKVVDFDFSKPSFNKSPFNDSTGVKAVKLIFFLFNNEIK